MRKKKLVVYNCKNGERAIIYAPTKKVYVKDCGRVYDEKIEKKAVELVGESYPEKKAYIDGFPIEITGESQPDIWVG